MWLTDRRAVPVLISVTLAVFAVFSLWPDLDLRVTGAFYDGQGFAVASNARIEWLRLALWDAAIAMALLAIGMTLATALLRAPLLGMGAKLWGYVVLVFVLGPGVLVNGLLKQYWGRARPADTANFGGTAQFTPPYMISDQCASNCSFVSGEAAGAAAFAIAVLLVLDANRARLPNWGVVIGQGAAIAVPLFTAWQRVAVGRHFLSDVLLAMLFVAVIAAGLARAMRLR